MTRATLLLFSLLLVSCGASKRATRTEQTLQLEQAMGSHLQVADTSQEVMTVTTEANDNTETVTEEIEYDTSLPVDTETGLAPVKRKVVQTTRKASAIQQQATTDAQRRTTLTQSDTTTTALQEQTTTQERSRKGLNWWQSTLCTIGGLSLIGAVLWLLVKFIKRRLTII